MTGMTGQVTDVAEFGDNSVLCMYIKVHWFTQSKLPLGGRCLRQP